mgnify:CR=1 FL=1
MYKILDLSKKEEWNSYFEQIDNKQQDIYYKPEYYELFEKEGVGKAKCFVFKMNKEIALYPFILNSVNRLGYKLENEYFDIQGAYGYNGVISTSYKNDFRTSFFQALNQYCHNANIIAEFIRFNPLIKNHNFCILDEAIYLKDNVLIDLEPKLDEIWMKSFDNGVRKAVKKGRRNQLKFESYLGSELNNELLEEFIRIYYSTMKRNKAKDFYFFSRKYFNNVIKLLPENSLFSFVKKHDDYISIEFNYFHKLYAYGFCGGTLAKYFKYSPNSFLRFELIKVLKNIGIKYYSIGSGIKRNDSIYKFKKSFSRNIKNKFYIGKRIYNEEVHNKVIKQWKQKSIKSYKENKNKVLGYREI